MIKNHNIRRTIAVFLILNFLSTLIPCSAIYAQNNGPNAPEASGFEPVSATDMVNLSSGDMAYVLPLLEIDGFPVTLSYHAGIPMDMDASWVGLGWNINTGSIARGVVSTPDDWNKGRSMKFTFYDYETETYTVNVGVGYGKAAEVGVGLSWGSNKSLSGSVSASIGPISASIDTGGNYSVGLNSSVITKGLGFSPVDGEGSAFGGSLSLSGNTKGGSLSVGANAGYSKNGLTAGMGVSISGNGIGAGFSIGGGNNKSGGDKRSAGGGGSIGSFSAGDMSVSSSGFYVPISIGIFSFGFGYQKQTIRYAKGLNRYGFGTLYQRHTYFASGASDDMYNLDVGERNDITASGVVYDDDVADLQRRNYYGDMYDQELPQSEIEFIKDYKDAIEKLNFTYAGYDSYNVNASGISGNMTPLIGKNVVLIGEGYEGSNSKPNDSKEKIKVFYHNAMKRARRLGMTPKLPVDKSLQSNNFHFAFDGQITEDVDITAGFVSSPSKNTNYFDLSDFVSNSKDYTKRPKMGSFVEVFTNSQLDNDPSNMLMPTSVYNGGSTLSRANTLGYIGDGIGGYKITAPDGKTYHFAQPVYQYEEIEHFYVEIENALNANKNNSTSKRSATPYATHWLLTAITGPDYIDNGNNYPDEDDLGYWLRLDHGHWSNAYAWRSPYANSQMVNQDNSITTDRKYRSYSTFNKADVEKSDGGHFIQGRKDLYYLDKIVSRNQIAYFVKDIRKDGIGTDLDYNFTNINGATLHPTFNEETIKGREWARYEKEYSLKLDKIIITKNTQANRIDSNTGNSLVNIPLNQRTYTDRYYAGYGGGLFKSFLPSSTQTHRIQQSEKIIDINDFNDFDYSKALKVIKFDHSYTLAKSTPNSEASGKGKLTLDKVHFYGRGTREGAREYELYDYMPPYKFSYKRPNLHFSRNDNPAEYGNELLFNKKDSWGFIEGEDSQGSLADSWSLNQIETPQGSIIDIEYEEDDYYVEAFSRRYWKDNLMFKVVKTKDTPIDEFNIYVKYDPEYDYKDDEKNKFTKYFNTGDRLFMDLWIGVRHHTPCWNHSDRRGKIDIKPKEGGYEVISVSNDQLIVKVVGNEINDTTNSGAEPSPGLVLNAFFAKRNNMPTRKYHKEDRGSHVNHEVGGVRDCDSNAKEHTISYKLLGTKSPTGNSGGGLKVTKITVNDEAGAKYETTYDYKVLGTDKSSGITSFYPVFGTTFVPYQNELPGPGVMYEWVTMTAQGYTASGRKLPTESTRYHYYTLNSNFDIFNPNILMKDKDDEVIFSAKVDDYNPNTSKVIGKDIKIEKNLAKIGQLISIEKFNSKGHLMNKTENSYTNKEAFFKETFTSMKSIYKYDYVDNGSNSEFRNRILDTRLLSLSSKKDYGKVLNKVTTITPFGTSSIQYSNPDPYLGTYRTSERTMSDGTKVKETKLPAYEKYSKMGSKIIDSSNKNMLTQEAMNITSVETPDGWKTTNASVTTWNNDWFYRSKNGVETSPVLDKEKIWRKHKNYVWKGDLDKYGSYGKELGINDFKWGLTDTQINTEWNNVSEITRYTHFSAPIETKDINNNYAASKMDPSFSKTIAGGNAKYTEMYYSGAEITSTENGEIKTEDEFTFENVIISNIAHTGENAIVIKGNAKAFKLNIDSRDNSTLNGKKFRPGKYKISYWLYTPNIKVKDAPIARVIYGREQVSSLESVKSGDWTLKNHVINVNNNTNIELYLSNEGYSSSGIVDDFRIHPVESSMNSYVYDKETDELRYILDANNLATEFKYDKAGRLCKTFKEVVDQKNNTEKNRIGGFKLIKEYTYRYKNAPAISGICGCCDLENTIYYNTEKSEQFFKNDCETDFVDLEGILYVVSVGTYSSLTSQLDADNQALEDVASNGQSFANTNSTCTPLFFYNTTQSGKATKNNCSNGKKGKEVTYTVVANTYQSTISQADADQKAIDDVNLNKQTNANSLGACICPSYPDSCNNFQCLIKGTLITLPDGSQKLIENLKVGDDIYSVNIKGLDIDQTKEEGLNWSVNNLITKPSTTKIMSIVETNYEEIYSLNNGLLEATWYHLHLVNRNNEWKIREFNTIQVGDKIIDKNNKIIYVTSIELIKKPVTVYKLDVEGLDVYYANNILTHNK